MDIIREIIRNIITLALIFSCLELFLPKGEMSRFVRLGAALIMLAMIILPAASGLEEMKWEWPAFQEAENAGADLQQKTAQITMILEEQAMDVYEKDLATNAAAAACLAPGIISAEAVAKATPEGGDLQLEIYAVKDTYTETATAEANIREILDRYYITAKENIRILIREEKS